MLLQAKESILICIDYQAKLLPALHAGEAALKRAIILAQAAKLLRVPCLGTEQNPAGLGAMPEGLRSLCAPVMPKMSFSACEDGLVDLIDQVAAPQGATAKSLPKHLQKQESKRSSLILAGVEAHVCLMQTALHLIETDEFEVSIVCDASTSRTLSDRDAAFDRLASEGARLVTSEMVIFEWLGSAEHPKFKEIHALIK
jgi:nicotinamidase-related amidase